jgi:hypothetical protein
MDKDQHLLVLEGREAPRDRRLGSRIDRAKALTAISESGARVRHDSGGRLIVIEAPEEAVRALADRLPDARLVPVETDVRSDIADLDPTESLFLEALQIRTSEEYRKAKRERTYGDTPEEQELFSAPDVREEY